MSYLARIEPQSNWLPAFAPPVADPAAEPDFTPLEWSVIRLARVDGLSTLCAPGRWHRFVSWVTGIAASPDLANPQLEALRRAAVLSWHFGFSVPGDDVAAFLSAGFSPDQYELLVSSVRAAVAGTPPRNIA